MYINWVHQYVPPTFASLALTVNPVFIYLIFSEKVAILGNYRYLLMYFACFNLIYSTFVLLLPIYDAAKNLEITFPTIHTYRYCFSIFTSDGHFLEASSLNLNLLIARCSLIACSYAVLLSHFVYRYLAVKTSNYTGRKFPIFMLGSLILTSLFFGYGFAICAFGNSPAGKAYLRESYFKTHNIDSMKLNIIAAVFYEVPDGLEYRSYASIGLLTIQSVTSLTLFITLGTMTIRSINRLKFNMSDKTKILQRQLMKALAIQTIIPIFISFSPCVLSWYSPIFNIDLGSGISNLEVNALATFPFCDPIAIILCIPVLRRQIFFRKKMIPIQRLDINTTVT